MMETNKLNPPEHEIFKLILEYIQEYGTPPYRNNIWFEERTIYQGSYISNVKAELRKLKLIDDELRPTSRGKAYARLHFGDFTVNGVEIRVQGSVSASPSEDLLVNLEDLDIPSEDTILLPNSSPTQDTFALRVSGPSMKEVGIFDGDYAIVEMQDSLWWPDPQDVIIANYLPHDPKRSRDYKPNQADFIGPVIKVYKCRFQERGCELGWRRANEKNPYIIYADELRPIGKVIGIYRNLSQFSLLDM